MSQPDEISIRFPARPGYLYLSRLNASAVGGEAGLDVDELEDLRLAVNEVVTFLTADAEGDGHVELDMLATSQGIEIRGTRHCEAELPPRQLDEFVQAMLGATVDSHEVIEASSGRSIELHKSKKQ